MEVKREGGVGSNRDRIRQKGSCRKRSERNGRMIPSLAV